jgi:hypothetical protein
MWELVQGSCAQLNCDPTFPFPVRQGKNIKLLRNYNFSKRIYVVLSEHHSEKNLIIFSLLVISIFSGCGQLVAKKL